MQQTKVKDVMTRNLETIRPDATLQEAAQKMATVECGVLPVGAANNMEGIITDRDIVIRAIAQGKDPNAERVRDYMTEGVCCCREDDSLEQAGDKMRENQVSRLLVQDAQGKICGILTFGAILRKDDSAQEISRVVEHAVGSKAA